MANELIQWIMIVGIAIVLLGVLRQVALGVPVPATAGGASGPPVGAVVPRDLVTRLLATLSGGLPEDLLVAFVKEGCLACQQLLAEVEVSWREFGEQTLVLVAKSPSEPFREALQIIGVPCIFDDDGKLWRACGVSATPLILKVDQEGRVLVKEVTHHVGKVAAAA